MWCVIAIAVVFVVGAFLPELPEPKSDEGEYGNG
jgi:hypothetical protein